MAQFEDDCAHELWTWIPVTTTILAAAVNVIRQIPKSAFIRGADAVHLIAARESGFTQVYTGDGPVEPSVACPGGIGA